MTRPANLTSVAEAAARINELCSNPPTINVEPGISHLALFEMVGQMQLLVYSALSNEGGPTLEGGRPLALQSAFGNPNAGLFAISFEKALDYVRKVLKTAKLEFCTVTIGIPFGASISFDVRAV